MQRVIFLNAIIYHRELQDFTRYLYIAYDTKLYMEIYSPDACSFDLYLKYNNYVMRTVHSNRSNNLHWQTKEILSKYCKLNAAMIEACINRTRVLKWGLELTEYSRIFARLALLFTRLTLRPALHVSHRANERVSKYTSLLSLLSFAFRRTCSILALCISCLFQYLPPVWRRIIA